MRAQLRPYPADPRAVTPLAGRAAPAAPRTEDELAAGGTSRARPITERLCCGSKDLGVSRDIATSDHAVVGPPQVNEALLLHQRHRQHLTHPHERTPERLVAGTGRTGEKRKRRHRA